MSLGIQHTLSTQLASDSSAVYSGSVTEVGSQEISNSQPYPASTSGAAYAISFTGSNLQSFILLSTQDLAIQVNSTGSPALTINLVAGSPMSWSKSSAYFANPFSGITVTNFYITCSASSTLKMKFLLA